MPTGTKSACGGARASFIKALSNTDPAQRYPMCDFLLDRDCVLDADTTDGTNPFHILFAQCARATSTGTSHYAAASWIEA